VKEFLSQQGVEFEDRNVSRDPAYLEEVRRLGYAGVPVTIVGDRQILGFDRAKIEAALGL
jgi:glutaredoxin